MEGGALQEFIAPSGLLRIEDCLASDGGVILPPGVTLSALIDRNIANVGDTVAYRYLDYTRSERGFAHELTWNRLGIRIRAIGAQVQRVASRGDRVAVGPRPVRPARAFQLKTSSRNS